jgi:hypothetical protein
MFGQIVPLFMSWLAPHRLERAMVVWASLMTGTFILLVGATLALPVSAGGWAWLVPGTAYLFCFGLIGAGELGGSYFPSYASSLSATAQSARNLALITLATPASSFSPVLHGALTDRYGFPASFAFGIVTAIIGLFLVLHTRSAARPAG